MKLTIAQLILGLDLARNGGHKPRSPLRASQSIGPSSPEPQGREQLVGSTSELSVHILDSVVGERMSTCGRRVVLQVA